MSRFHSAERILIPVHSINPKHWFLVHVNTTTKVVEIYDPSKSGSARYVPVCIRIAQIFASIAGRADACLKLDIRLIECAQQPSGSVDCGLYVTTYAKHLVNGIIPTADKFTNLKSKDLRAILYWELRFADVLVLE
jgi:Ulp1 family protease